VIRDYARKQEEGFGPFYFYRVETLQKTFAAIDPGDTGKNALAIEQSLRPERLDAAQAYTALRSGERIGHTAAVLQSELK
jgi:hypothetical protein